MDPIVTLLLGALIAGVGVLVGLRWRARDSVWAQVTLAGVYHTRLRQIVADGLLTELAYQKVWLTYCETVLDNAAETMARSQLATSAAQRLALGRQIVARMLAAAGAPLPPAIQEQWALQTL